MGPAGGYFEGGGGGGSYYPTAFPAYPAAAYHGSNAAAPDQVSPLDSSSGSESGAPPWLTDSSFDWAAESGSGSAGTHGSADSPSARTISHELFARNGLHTAARSHFRVVHD